MIGTFVTPPRDRVTGRWLVLLAAAALLGGCEVSSRLEPSEPIPDLDDSESAQLCRFTADVLASADWECTGEAPPRNQTDYESCVAEPPWVAHVDVGDWEDCVRARLADPCDSVSGCLPDTRR